MTEDRDPPAPIAADPTTPAMTPSEEILSRRRRFMKQVGVGGAAAATTVASPAVLAQKPPIRWRLQTYSGAPLGAHVIKPQIDAFNKAANGEMVI